MEVDPAVTVSAALPTGGRPVLLRLPDGLDTDIADVKATIEAAAGVPAKRAAVLFAGEELQDGRSLRSYEVAEYGSTDVVLSVALRPGPLLIFLSSTCGSVVRGACVDHSTPLASLPQLLAAEGLATEASFHEVAEGDDDRDTGCAIIVATTGGRTLQLQLTLQDTFGTLQTAIEGREGTPVAQQRMVFRGRADGHLAAFVAAERKFLEFNMDKIPADEDEGKYALPPAPPVMSKTSDANYRAACDALCLLDTNLPGFDVPYERRAG